MADKQNISPENSTAVIEMPEATIRSQNEQIAKMQQQLDRLQELLINAQRAQFGQSSEKRSYVMKNSLQLTFFNEAELEQDMKAPEQQRKHSL